MGVEIVKVKSAAFSRRKKAIPVSWPGDWILMLLTVGRDYKTQAMPDTAVTQAEQAMRNVEGALASVGASFADVVRRRSSPGRSTCNP